MIQIYCRHHHKSDRGSICDECFSLYIYAIHRLDRCPFGEGKGNCKQCPIHCYKPDRREQIRRVMRYS
ncbi:MAG: nitrous oxide-stimulated promoter family protein, partial [Bacteroidaceae bacterium]|nr:nitrous oxide-stimulated promoter family protein [Bacteroidaceae bacterium]